MTPERWQQIKAVLAEANEQPPDERATWLRTTCGDDDTLRHEVESLLALENQLDGFIEEAPVTRSSEQLTFQLDDDQEGRTIGPYRLGPLLGRGGMGAVYRAERQEDFEQQVAIKLLRPAMVSQGAIRRFLNERQILAHLEHPNIARLLDGGTTDDGVPYLVMELIEGVPIDQFCDQHRLSTRRRVELFVHLCAGLSLAHQNLVIHRDLKPGNILVGPGGIPKLLDFGIAKHLSPEDRRDDAETLTQDSAMTPRYASPEQLKGEPIGTASDVYSLAVVLYKVLTGHLPCQLEGRNPVELAMAVCEEDPLPPSQVVQQALEVTGSDGEVWRRSPRELAASRDGDLRTWRRSLSGDLDSILLKALRKRPMERYPSVEQLAADLQRHLNGLPVLAHRADFLYRAGKFVRRHRWGVAAFSTITALVLSFTFALQRQLDQTETARDQAESIAEFMVDLFRAAAPDRPAGEESTVRDLLDAGRQKLDQELKDEPEVRSVLLMSMGEVYTKLGDYGEAKTLLEETTALMRQLHPRGHTHLARALNDLAAVHYHLGELDQSEARGREVIAMRRSLGHTDDLIKPMNNLASLLMERGDARGAEAIYRESLELRRRSLGPRHPNIAVSLRSLAMALYTAGDLEAAEPLLRESLEIRREYYGDESPKVAMVLHSLGRLYMVRARSLAPQDPELLDALEEAEQLMTRALHIRHHSLGDDHLHTALTRKDLAALMLERGETDTAAVLLESALAVLYGLRECDHPDIAYAEALRGRVLARQGQKDEARSCWRHALEILTETKGPESHETVTIRQWLDDTEEGSAAGESSGHL